jgi:hypothetical protein
MRVFGGGMPPSHANAGAAASANSTVRMRVFMRASFARSGKRAAKRR